MESKNMSVTERLFALRDVAYGDFQSGLVPNIARERFIGVRVPLLRKLAKELRKSGEAEDFLGKLPHFYYEEDMLHGLIISEIRDYGACISALDVFLPYVNNWAICDTMSPKSGASCENIRVDTIG